MLLELDAITLDQDLQPRARIHEDVLVEYADRVSEGVEFPAVIVFNDGATMWLADGYHRWHGHKAAGRAQIEADVRQGSKRDAITYALAANAEHGKQRGTDDYEKAYLIAVKHELVAPADVAALTDLLRCSDRWARHLTRGARDESRRARDAEIITARERGEPQRKIAERLGLSHDTVGNVGRKWKSSEIVQPQSIATIPREWAEFIQACSVIASLGPVDLLPQIGDALLGQAVDQARRAISRLEAFEAEYA